MNSRWDCLGGNKGRVGEKDGAGMRIGGSFLKGGERLGAGFLEVFSSFLYLCLRIFGANDARLHRALLRPNRTAKDNKKQDHG